jgi:riboflavin kinase/FMN adenylyltransferase
MDRYDNIESAARGLASGIGRVATIGFFDGVHRGHQALLGDLKDWAAEVGGESVVVTFGEHPQAVLGAHPPVPVVSLEHRLLLLEREGIDAALVLDFDERVRALTPEDFVRSVLVEGLGAGGLQMGFDSAFGNRRLGTFEYLDAMRDELGLEIRSSRAEILGGVAVSSTRVREAVSNWSFVELENLLGHPFSIMGTVVEGDGRGRQLGFPTANLALSGASVPSPGVYFCDVLCLGERPHGRHSWRALAAPERPDGFFRGVMNIGRRPTLTDGKEASSGSIYDPGVDTVEVHLLDYEGDLYGQCLEVFVLSMHRGEKKFSSVEELTHQIRSDVEARLG